MIEVYIERIKQVQPIINAVTHDRFKEALDEAKKLDQLLSDMRNDKKDDNEFTQDERDLFQSPLLGIPISVKESIMVNGMKNTVGLWNRKDVYAQEDAIVVKNIKRFGMIPICITNVPEGTLYWADCQNPIYGRTLNPYDLSRITGASSGGEGALIGSGASICGLGSDIGGSLRIPAHYCGITSHKASPFLISSEGNSPPLKEYRLRLFTIGPMCRYASDLRPLLKCLISDKDNSKKDTYIRYQPKNIEQLRKDVLLKLDQYKQPQFDLSQIKLFYFEFNKNDHNNNQQSKVSKSAYNVQKEFLDTQDDILNHFKTKFNTNCQLINLDKYFRKTFIIWQSMLIGGGTIDRELEYNENELNETFDVKNVFLEFLKIPFGISKHSKESIFSLLLGQAIPKDKTSALEMCEKFEKLNEQLKEEFHQHLGDWGVLIMPTMPTVAYKHNVGLLKTQDLKFPSLFNRLQVPVTHVHLKLDKKNQLPYGFSIVSKPYNDAITISIAEEIELAFGGWQQPTIDNINATNTIDDKTTKTPLDLTSNITANEQNLINNNNNSIEIHQKQDIKV